MIAIQDTNSGKATRAIVDYKNLVFLAKHIVIQTAIVEAKATTLNGKG